jgi:hypothetical protein
VDVTASLFLQRTEKFSGGMVGDSVIHWHKWLILVVVENKTPKKHLILFVGYKV